MSAIPLDVEPLLGEYDCGPLTLTREGARVKSAAGVYGPGATTSITLSPVASHPLTGHALIAHSEADRVAGMQRFYTRVEVLAAEGASDRITFEGATWRAVKVWRYGADGAVWIVDAVRQEANAP